MRGEHLSEFLASLVRYLEPLSVHHGIYHFYERRSLPLYVAYNLLRRSRPEDALSLVWPFLYNFIAAYLQPVAARRPAASLLHRLEAVRLVALRQEVYQDVIPEFRVRYCRI